MAACGGFCSLLQHHMTPLGLRMGDNRAPERAMVVFALKSEAI